MNREDILSAARKENKNHDFAEDHVNTQAGFYGYAVGAVLCILMMVLSKVFTGETNLSCAIVYLGMYSVRLYTRYRMKKEKWELAAAVLVAAITLAGVIVHICNLAGVL